MSLEINSMGRFYCNLFPQIEHNSSTEPTIVKAVPIFQHEPEQKSTPTRDLSQAKQQRESFVQTSTTTVTMPVTVLT